MCCKGSGSWGTDRRAAGCRRMASSSGNLRATPTAQRMQSRGTPRIQPSQLSIRPVGGAVFASVQTRSRFGGGFSTTRTDPKVVGVLATSSRLDISCRPGAVRRILVQIPRPLCRGWVFDVQIQGRGRSGALRALSRPPPGRRPGSCQPVQRPEVNVTASTTISGVTTPTYASFTHVRRRLQWARPIRSTAATTAGSRGGRTGTSTTSPGPRG